MIRTKLDDVFRQAIVCPLCKTDVIWFENQCACDSCGNRFTRNLRGVWDFVLAPPSFLRLAHLQLWEKGQHHYQEWSAAIGEKDDMMAYFAELDGVQEIYREQFQIAGRILDVGGHQGRLRHFLAATDDYLCVDPYDAVFDQIDSLPNLLNVYPCLSSPCNALRAQAERLPLRAGSFDFVHMRSVLDHFFDPHQALGEAHRVLKRGGGLVIGVHVEGGGSSIRQGSGLPHLLSRVRKKIRDQGVSSMLLALLRRMSGRGEKDVHAWHPTHAELLELVQRTHFRVETVHWQKPPNDHVVYLLARKP